MQSPFNSQENPPQSRPSRRPPISRAEWSFAALCLLAMLLLGAGVWIANGRGPVVGGATLSAQNWRLTPARARMASALVGDQLWVLGGIDSAGMTRGDAETFDLIRQPSQPSRGVLSPATLLPRSDHTAQAVGRDIYIFGGLGGVAGPLGVLGIVEKLDTRTGFVSTLAPMPTPRRMAHSVTHRGKIYVAGGTVARGPRVKTLEIYDIATNTWKTGAPMPNAREGDLALWRGQIIATGGYNGASQNGGVLTAVDAYDIAKGKWRTLPALSQPISAHHVITSGDWLFLFGDYRTLSRVLAYNARTGQTRELFASGFQPRRHVIAHSLRGRAYVAGGSISDTRPPLPDVQIFDLKRLQQMAQAAP